MDNATIAHELYEKAEDDLVALNRFCLRYQAGFSSVLEDCIELTDYGVSIRYPFHIEINEDDMNSALKAAEFIAKYVISLEQPEDT